MHSTVVQAKLHRPTQTLPIIPRPHLLEHLQNGVKGKVTLVSAPAGFGKSTIVSAWLDQIELEAGAIPALKVSWLGLEEADNHLLRFVRYLVAAIEESFPQSCKAVTQLLQEGSLPTVEAFADTLVESLTQLSGQLVLVLDDLHLIDDDAIFAFLTRLILHISSKLHLVLITRIDPPFPISRWRAQGILSELRLHDLGFTLAETKTFLEMNLAQPPDDKVAALLQERTEGWVVGLRLVALALSGTTDYAGLVAGFEANSNRYIIDYLVDDVLDQQPPGVQQFLICTSILTRFNPSLCAAVVDIDRNAIQQHINYLTRTNLFLIELSSPPQWYRYHHQFQSMLLSRLYERYDPQAIALLHRQAAAWLAAHDQIDEALRHFIAIPDFAAAADLVESQRVAALNEQRFYDLDGWLSLLPPTLLNQRPALLISQAWVQNYWLNDTQCLASTERAEIVLDEQAASLSKITQSILRAEIYALRITVARPQDRDKALLEVQRHWQQIRLYLSYTHWSIVVTLSHNCYFMQGTDLALEMLWTAYEQTVEWSPMARCRLLYSAGILYWYHCNLAQAEQAFQQSLHLARQYKLHLAVLLAQFGLALIAGMRNQQEAAEDFYLEVLKDPHYQNGLRAVFGSYTLIGIYADRGRPEMARKVLEGLKVHALLVGRPYLLSQVEALEAYLALVDGKPAQALHWELAASRSKMSRPEDRVPLIRVRILLAEASPVNLHKAAQLLETMIRSHEFEHRWSLWLENQTLLALVRAKMGEIDLALTALGKAVQQAVPNGVVGYFVEHGQSMKELLTELGKDSKYAQSVQLLLAAFPMETTALPARPPATVVQIEGVSESLTEREINILKLLAIRLSNKEIAHELILSVHTVRNHVANIFSKLQVEGRFQAVDRARALGLLPPVDQHPTVEQKSGRR